MNYDVEIDVRVITYDACIYRDDVEMNKQRRFQINESRITEFIRHILKINDVKKDGVINYDTVIYNHDVVVYIQRRYHEKDRRL